MSRRDGKRRETRVLGLIATMALLLVVACGDDDDTSSGGDEQAAGGGGADNGGTVPNDCTGEPILLGFDVNMSATNAATYENVVDAAQAAVQAENEECVQGRPLELLPCDQRNDVNATADCARKAVEEGVVAQVASIPGFGDTMMPIYSEAGIPVFGNTANSSELLQDPLSYPTFNVTPTVLAMASGAHAAGAENAVFVTIESGSTFFVELANRQMEDLGLESEGVVLIPATAQDVSVYAGQIVSSGADAIITALGDDLTENLLKNLQQQGVDVQDTQFWAGGAIITQRFVDEYDGDLEGVFTTGPFWVGGDTSNEGIAQMHEELEAAGYDTEGIIDWATNAWHNIHVIADVMRDLDTIDPASLIAAFDSMGLVERPEAAPYDFSQPAFPDHPVMGQMRIFGREHYMARVVDGEIVPLLDHFVDPMEPFELDL